MGLKLNKFRSKAAEGHEKQCLIYICEYIKPKDQQRSAKDS